MNAPARTGRARPPATVTAAPIETVRIGDPDDPTTVRVIRLRWLCPVDTCRRPRGRITTERHAHHDARGRIIAWTRVHRWHPPCGHVQLNRELLAEAQAADIPAPRAPREAHRAR